MLGHRLRNLLPPWRRRISEPPAIVLTYHSVGDRRIDPYGQAVRAETFAQQLSAVRRRAEIVTVDDLLRRLMDGHSTSRTAVVTFDDGYVDTLTVALPIAEALGVPFTVFVTTGPLVDAPVFWWDALAQLLLGRPDHEHAAPISVWDLQIDLRDASTRLDAYRVVHERLRRMPGDARDRHMRELREHLPLPSASFDAGRPMTADELAAMAAHPLVTIGAHTMTHPSLADLAPHEQRRELTESRAVLESRIGRAVDLLAYPFGKSDNVSAITQTIAREAGYRAAFVTTPAAVRPPVDFWALPRLTMHDWPAAGFEARLDVLING